MGEKKTEKCILMKNDNNCAAIFKDISLFSCELYEFFLMWLYVTDLLN